MTSTTADTPMTARVYAADGTTLLCEFPFFVSLNILDVYNNVGSHTFNWNFNSPGGSNLQSDSDLQIAALMDRRDGNGYQEIWRGFYDQDNYDPSMSESAIVQATGRSIIAILNNAIVYPKAGVGSTTTSWSFSGSSPGAIMHDLLVAAQARGCFPLLTWDFTSGQDSSGAAWAHGFTSSFTAGTKLFDLLVSMAQGGLCDFSMTGFVLHMYNSKTTLATDRSSTVFFRRGREIISSPDARDRTQIGTVMLAQGDNGFNIERTATTYGALGRKEVFLSQSGVTDAATMNYWADQALGAIDDQQISFTPTYVIDTSLGTPIPWKDYTPGNYVSLDYSGTPVKFQVGQIAASCGPGGPTFVQPTLNDIFFPREVLVSAALSRINGGAIISGPGVSATPQPGPNPTMPNAPAFTPASIYTAAYFSPATGTTLAQIELQWTTPTNTDGTTMIDGYQYLVQYRLSTTPIYPVLWSQLQGKPWSTINGNPWTNPLATPQNTQWTTAVVSIDNNNAIIQGLICGETYQFQIACTDVSGNTSAFSAISNFTTAADSVAPTQPDAPVVNASMVAVQVLHDLGVNTGGTYNLANDLDHLEVHYSYDPAFIPQPGVGSVTYLGKLIANAGMMAAKISAVGTFQVSSTTGIYIRVIGVDVSGNSSPPSPSSGVTAVLIDDSHISSLSVSKLVAGIVTATIILGGTITTANVGQRVTMDVNGFHAYDANGNQIFFVSASSPIITLGQNSAGANSITLDTSQNYPTIYFNTSGSSSSAFLNGSTDNGSTALGLNAGSYTSGVDGTSTVSQRLFMETLSTHALQLGVIDSNQSLHGGNALVSDLTTTIGFYSHGTQVGGFNQIYDTSNSDVQMGLRGYWQDRGLTAFPNSNEGLFFATWNGMTNTQTSFTSIYNTTMLSTPLVIGQFSCGAPTTIPASNISARSATGWTFTVSAAPGSTWSIFAMQARTR